MDSGSQREIGETGRLRGKGDKGRRETGGWGGGGGEEGGEGGAR